VRVERLRFGAVAAVKHRFRLSRSGAEHKGSRQRCEPQTRKRFCHDESPNYWSICMSADGGSLPACSLHGANSGRKTQAIQMLCCIFVTIADNPADSARRC
jgi:hypothetical protein